MNEKTLVGFEYTVERIVRGVVVEREVTHNLMPVEGINHVLGAALKGGTQVPTWYIGLYSGNYTPLSTDLAATFPSLAGELTTYDEATRREWVEGSVVSGALDNLASRAEFTSSADATVYGGFISSNSTKGGTGGVLLSAVRFSSPKAFNAGEILRVTAGFTFTSV